MTAPALVLHGYWRSSAAYRVRIGLGLKGLVWQDRPVHLVWRSIRSSWCRCSSTLAGC